MPQKLSKAQFAALVESMPGASEEEILKAAQAKEQSLFGKVKDAVTQPLTDAPSRAARQLADEIDKPTSRSEFEVINIPGVGPINPKGFVAGAVQGAGDVASSLTSPLNLALTALGFGSEAAAARGLTGASRGMRAAEAAINAAQVGEGAGNVAQGIKNQDLGQVGAGALEAATGAGFARNALKRPIQSRVAGDLSSAASRPVPGESLPKLSPAPGRPSPDVPPVARMAGDVPPEFHAVLDSFSDPAKFVDPQKSPLLNEDYGILTWANPGKQLPEAENVARNAELVKLLKQEGYNPIKQMGVFDGQEESFLVPGMKDADVARFGRQGNQVSVISRGGYRRLADDAVFPNQGVAFDQNADNYYSVIDLPNGQKVKYQMSFPDEAFGPPVTSETPKAPAAVPRESAVATGTEEPSPRSKGSTTALAIAAPAAAAAIPDDPDSKLDDYGRLGLGILGAAGLGAAVRGRQVPELSPVQQTVHKGAAALWLGGKKAWKEAVGPEASPQMLAASQKVLDRHLQTTANQLPTMKKLLAMNKKGVADHEWYDKTSAELKDMFGQDADLVARLFAATSNNATVMANASLAMKALLQIKAGEPIHGFLPDVIENVKRAAAGEPLNGRKIDNFAKALSGDPDAVVIDRWIMRAFGFNRGTAPTDLQYDFMENAIKQIAKEQGQTPRQVQAAIWFAFKNEAEKGKKRPPSPAPPQAIRRSIDIRHGEALRDNRKFDKARQKAQQPGMF